MITQKNIIFLGGDARQITAAVKLLDDGYRVSAYLGDQQNDALFQHNSVEEALTVGDIIVLPLPATVDGLTLNAPFLKNEQINLLRIVELISEGKLVVGGRIPDNIVQAFTNKGVRVIDYFKSEPFQIENAYTTSEAAVSIAMNNLKRNVRGANFAITGYGRIARTLTELLIKLGARVVVLARKESDLAWARLAGASVIRLNDENIYKLTNGFDIIFNTVPTWLFFERFLLEVDKKTLIIDLASSPGGVDVSAARKLSSKVLWASSLPGKYAPESAGTLIADCIRDIALEENL